MSVASPLRRVAPYGSDAVLVELADGVEPYSVASILAEAGVGDERICGWRSVLVTGIDPDHADTIVANTLLAAVDLTSPATGAPAAAHPPPTHQLGVAVPFVDDGADLEEIAALTSMTVDEVVEVFTTPTYRVVCLGFVRGFTYLEGLDPRLATLRRRPTPRRSVPAGSIAIGGGQAGIYPTASPGGWHLLGTTDELLFDPTHRPPCRFAPGDLVRFERRPKQR